MADRLPANAVIQGTRTTADKIRALAKAGYLRTEIRDILDIRYQHVRRVLVRSGIKGGLQRNVKGSGRKSDPPPARKRKVTPVSREDLLKAGFRYVTFWRAEGSEGIRLDAVLPQGSAVYALVVGDLVTYIGKSSKNVRQRFYFYGKPGKTQTTSIRIKSKIRAAIDSGKDVCVLIAQPEPSAWNGLPVSVVVGLEEGLIKKFQPPWNMMK